MKNKKAKGEQMSLQTLSFYLIFTGAIIAAFGALGKNYYGKKESEKKEAEWQKKFDEIRSEKALNIDIDRKIDLLLLKSSEEPREEWNSVNMIDIADWFGGEVIDYMYFVFKSSSGIIRGELRIKGTEEEYSFSTMANTNLPIAVRNLYLPEKGHFRKLPTIEYRITEKTDPFAVLSIVMVGAHGVGERDVIRIEKPVKITERNNP